MVVAIPCTYAAATVQEITQSDDVSGIRLGPPGPWK